MIINADITIYNRKTNKETHFDEWKRTVIKGVHYFVDNKVTVGEKGLFSADVHKIRIPGDIESANQYLPASEYLQVEDREKYWTIRNDDIVVRGVCNIDIEKPADLKAQGIEYCKIVSWSDNRRGMTPHWRIGGE